MRLYEIRRQITEAPEDGTFAGVRFSEESVEQIMEFIEENDIPNSTPIDELHITLLFSKVPVPEYKPYGEYKKPLTAVPNGAKLWGQDEEKALVITLDCPALERRHKSLMAKHENATYDFDEYIPHVTLSYDAGEFDIDSLDYEDLGELEIVEEYRSDIEPSWKDKIDDDDE